MKKLLMFSMFSAVMLLVPSQSKAQKQQITESQFVAECIQTVDPHGKDNLAGNALLVCMGEYYAALFSDGVDEVFEEMMYGWMPTVDYFQGGTEVEYDPYLYYVYPIIHEGSQGLDD